MIESRTAGPRLRWTSNSSTLCSEAVAERLKELLSEMHGLEAKAARKALDELEGSLEARLVEQKP